MLSTRYVTLLLTAIGDVAMRWPLSFPCPCHISAARPRPRRPRPHCRCPRGYDPSIAYGGHSCCGMARRLAYGEAFRRFLGNLVYAWPGVGAVWIGAFRSKRLCIVLGCQCGGRGAGKRATGANRPTVRWSDARPTEERRTKNEERRTKNEGRRNSLVFPYAYPPAV